MPVRQTPPRVVLTPRALSQAPTRRAPRRPRSTRLMPRRAARATRLVPRQRLAMTTRRPRTRRKKRRRTMTSPLTECPFLRKSARTLLSAPPPSTTSNTASSALRSSKTRRARLRRTVSKNSSTWPTAQPTAPPLSSSRSSDRFAARDRSLSINGNSWSSLTNTTMRIQLLADGPGLAFAASLPCTNQQALCTISSFDVSSKAMGACSIVFYAMIMLRGIKFHPSDTSDYATKL